MADGTYQPKTYRDMGGDRITVAGGGILNIEGRITGLMPTTDYFVDSATGSDNDDGLSWANAKATINAAMTLAAALATRGRARIFVAPGGYTEDIVTPLNTECPFGQLVAVNPTTGMVSYGAAWLAAATAGGPTIHVKARGWLIEGFEIDGPASGGCILLDSTAASSSGNGTGIRNNLFWGGDQADFGIDTTGASHFCKVFNNRFLGIDGSAMLCRDSSSDQPGGWEIAHNHFGDNSNHINMNPRGFKNSWIHDNAFVKTGSTYTATKQLDNQGGDSCAIGPNNFLGSTYDNAGGYYPGSNENWYGNASQDGYTTANPAA